MNWPAVTAMLTGALAVAGAANYFVLLSIKLEISKLGSELREWARETFVEHHRMEAVEERMASLEWKVNHAGKAPHSSGN